MKGIYHVVVQNRYLKYEFDIRRNLTIIQGNSATGKTTLVEMIRESHLNENSGVMISCKCPCRVIEGDLWKEQIGYISNSIVFIDEGSSFVESKEFASLIKGSSNYFVIVTRENLDTLPISIEEVYGIKSSGKYGTLQPVYHEMYRLYDIDDAKDSLVYPSQILVEDSNSGYEFFQAVADKNGLICKSAQGKSNIFACLVEAGTDDEILVIADGATFASEMNRLAYLVSKNKKIHLYLPESFEWLLLSSDVIYDARLSKILKSPSDYIDSSNYFSWESFFTALLIEKTNGTYLQYSKAKLNGSYLQKEILDKVLSHMQRIRFDKSDLDKKRLKKSK